MVMGMTTSCSDVLDTESDRNIYDPSLSEKTDSMFYTLGILKGVQQAIDQYVLVNEMRGDLTTVNSHTETDLRQLSNFSATTANKYDSAYVYYRIINNCNYYIAHRDTTLLTGSHKVTIPEYVEAKAIRAWAYLQLAKTYGSVPFYTDPITSISQANRDYPTKDIKGICDELAPDLAKYAGQSVPNYGSNVSIGTTNAGDTKYVNYELCMIPVDVILGDLYLESNQYDKAAQSYFNYIRTKRQATEEYTASLMYYTDFMNLPNDLRRATTTGTASSWRNIFSMTATPSDIITYVPMAVNRLYGQTTDLPKLFGYDFYSTTSGSTSSNARYLVEREIDPSQSYYQLANSQDYYYVPSSAESNNIINTASIGDLRRYSTLVNVAKNDSNFSAMYKFQSANIPLYRVSTVYLKLAEAINRMGYPDVAFAILKDGIGTTQLQNADLVITTDTLEDGTVNVTKSGYLRPESRTLLTTTIPFLSTDNYSIFTDNQGIHAHGSGTAVSGVYSPYQMDAVVGNKLREIAANNNVTVGTTLNDTINAVEDLICDEYALETAFEGSRFGDLCRIARHKNEAGLYSANFGGEWLAAKLAFKNPVVNLAEENNWYMPFR